MRLSRKNTEMKILNVLSLSRQGGNMAAENVQRKWFNESKKEVNETLKENMVEGVEVVKESKDEGMKLCIRLYCYKYLRKWRKMW